MLQKFFFGFVLYALLNNIAPECADKSRYVLNDRLVSWMQPKKMSLNGWATLSVIILINHFQQFHEMQQLCTLQPLKAREHKSLL